MPIAGHFAPAQVLQVSLQTKSKEKTRTNFFFSYRSRKRKTNFTLPAAGNWRLTDDDRDPARFLDTWTQAGQHTTRDNLRKIKREF